MATAGSSLKKRRESYTLEFKLKVLEEVDKKRKKADICSQLFSLAKSTLSTFISQRSKLEELQHDAGPKRKCARSAQYSRLSCTRMVQTVCCDERFSQWATDETKGK